MYNDKKGYQPKVMTGISAYQENSGLSDFFSLQFVLRPCITNFFLLRSYQNDYGNWQFRQNDYHN